jgi:hypothetical protein
VAVVGRALEPSYPKKGVGRWEPKVAMNVVYIYIYNVFGMVIVFSYSTQGSCFRSVHCLNSNFVAN